MMDSKLGQILWLLLIVGVGATSIALGLGIAPGRVFRPGARDPLLIGLGISLIAFGVVLVFVKRLELRINPWSSRWLKALPMLMALAAVGGYFVAIFASGGNAASGVLLAVVCSLAIALIFALPPYRKLWQVVFAMKRSERLLRQGDLDFAAQSYRRALSLADGVLSSRRDMFTGLLLLSLAELDRLHGQLQESEPIHVQALRHLGAVKSQRPDMYSRGRLSLANLHMVQGRFEEAESHLRPVLETLRPAAHPVRVWAMARLAVTLCFLNKLAEAEDLARQAADLGEPQIKRGNSVACIILCSRAEVEKRLGHPAQAEASARRALNLYQKYIKKPDNPLLFVYLNALAEPTRLVGKLEEAEAICLRSQSLIEKAFGLNHFGLDGCLSTLARIRMTQKRFGEAQQLFDRCVAILEKNVVHDHPDLLVRQNEAAPSVTAFQGIV